MKKILLILTFITIISKVFSQQIPLDVFIQNRYNEITLDADTSLFTGFRSINWLEVKPYLNNTKTQIIDSAFGLSTNAENYAFKHLANSNWIQASNGKSTFTIDPYIVAAAGAQNRSNQRAIAQLLGGAFAFEACATINFLTHLDWLQVIINFLLTSMRILIRTEVIFPVLPRAT